MDQLEDTRPKFLRIIAKFFIPARIFLAIMGMLAIVNAYTIRLSLSITLTQLVPQPHQNKNETEIVCHFNDEKPLVNNVPEGRFDWSQKMQSFILGSFYIGYPITHIPGGMLAERYGGKWVLAMGILSTALLTFITPITVDHGGATGLIILRILIGLGEGPTYPALSALLSQWVPLGERGILGAMVLSGGQIGSVVANLFSGLILHHMTWPWVCYIFGICAVLWVIFFLLFCYSSPNLHPFISPKEKKYLEKELTHLAPRGTLPPTPWKSILTSIPVIVLIICQLGHDWGFFMMVTDLPKYMNDVLQFSVKKNGYYSSIPYVLMWLTSVFAGWMTDFTIKRSMINITLARKLNTGIAAIGPAICMVLASYAGCHRVVVVVFFIICMGLMGPYYAGMKLTPLDLSPNYSGTLMALANGIAALTGGIVPFIIGCLTPHSALTEWRIAFWVACAMLIATVIPYLIWASGEVQEWNNPKPKDSKDAK